jgi:hypothetical protein
MMVGGVKPMMPTLTVAVTGGHRILRADALVDDAVRLEQRLVRLDAVDVGQHLRESRAGAALRLVDARAPGSGCPSPGSGSPGRS